MPIPNIIFRKATPEDVEELIQLRIAFLKEVQTPEVRQTDDATLTDLLRRYFNENIPNDAFLAWLAIHEGEIVATSGLCFFQLAPGFTLLDGKIAYILNIFTLPEWRGQGLGKQIFERILQEAKNRGYKRITLHASDDGRPLYEKFGFRLTGDEMILKL
ncbi:GNAT family N-acetyltransferase [Runella sp.]|uniref:GNAT family N-acetyltransferase n=1 Tax=Runella sp. TaxID=1960881 RepID=UPI003D11FCC9